MRRLLALLTMPLVACGLSVVGVGSESADEAAEAGTADAREAAESDGATTPPVLLDASTADAPVEPADTGVIDAGTDAGPLPIATFTPGNSVTVNYSTTTLCSGNGSGASMKLTNTGSSTYLVRWINGGCVENDYGQVAPGAVVTWGSFKTHRWRLRRKSDNAIIVDFTLKANTTVDVK